MATKPLQLSQWWRTVFCLFYPLQRGTEFISLHVLIHTSSCLSSIGIERKREEFIHNFFLFFDRVWRETF